MDERIQKLCALGGVLFTLVFRPAVAIATESRVEWRSGSLDRILLEAQATQKPVFLVLKSDTCGNSRHFLSDVLQHPSVANFINQRTIPILLDQTADAETAKSYRIYATPGILLLRPNGEEVDRFAPYGFPEIIEILTREIEAGRTLPELTTELRAHPDSLQLMKKVLYKALRQIRFELALEVEDSMKDRHLGDYLKDQAQIHATFGLAYSFAQQHENAIERFHRLLDLPDADHAYAYRSIAIEYFVQERFVEGFETLRQGIRNTPQSNELPFFFMTTAVRYSLNLVEASTIGEQVRSRMSQSPVFEQGRILAGLAEVYQHRCLISLALERIREAIQIDPDEPSYPELLKNIDNASCSL